MANRSSHSDESKDRLAVEAVFTGKAQGAFDERLVSPSGVKTVVELVEKLKREHGEFREVIRAGERWNVRLEKAILPATVVTGDAGSIQSLRFFAPVLVNVDLADIVQQIRTLPGESAVVVVRDGVTLMEHQADRRMAVGSAFKLAVLLAYRKAVEEGRLDPQELCFLSDETASEYTGILQDWPAGTPVTLASLAVLMISLSDNTATDLLIDRLGISAEIAKTRSYFARHWPVSDPPQTPTGWARSARELVTLVRALDFSPELSVNLGPLEGLESRRAAFKGGQERSNLNFTGEVESAAGHRIAVSLTYNGSKPGGAEELGLAFTSLFRAADLA